MSRNHQFRTIHTNHLKKIKPCSSEQINRYFLRKSSKIKIRRLKTLKKRRQRVKFDEKAPELAKAVEEKSPQGNAFAKIRMISQF